MNKLIVFALLIFAGITTLNARDFTTVDTVRYRFTYAAVITTFTTMKDDDEIRVDVGDKHTYCYSKIAEDNRHYRDSIDALDLPDDDDEVYSGNSRPSSSFDYRILKNYPQKKKMIVEWETFKEFIYNDVVEKKQWILEKGDTTLLGYPCKKASCTYRGITWHVWYTLNIPIPEGPWKLDGLPGLIMSAEDAQGYYSFRCKGIQQKINQPMRFDFNNKIKTTPKKVNDLRKLQFTDFNAYLKLISGSSVKCVDAYHVVHIA